MSREENRTEALLAHIRAAAKRGRLSHAIIFSGPGDLTYCARYAAAAMECVGEGEQPCLTCDPCRKVLSGIHPDVTLVHDEQRKTLPVETLRDLRSDAYIRPNEGKRKVYIFDDCSQLTDMGQNVLLKVMEEGPPYAAFLFCAENASALLSTVRSRCVEFKLHDLPAVEADDEAMAFCRLLRPHCQSERAAFLMGLEVNRASREEVFAFLEQCRAILTASLAALYGRAPEKQFARIVSEVTQNLTKPQIMGTIELLEKYSAQSRVNVGVGHLMGALAAELEDITFDRSNQRPL